MIVTKLYRSSTHMVARAIQVRCRLLSACHCMGAPCLFGIQHPQERERAQQWYTAHPQISNIHYDILNRSCNSCPCRVAIHSLAACAQPATPRNRPGAADARSQQLSLKQIKCIRPQNMQHCVMHFCHRKDLSMHRLLPGCPVSSVLAHTALHRGARLRISTADT